MHVIANRNDAVLNIYNNILWANTAAAPSDSGADVYINDDGLNDGVGCAIHLYNNNFSNIEIVKGDHLIEGENITGNPNLDPDYRLTSDSPCRDTGSNSAPALPATDLVGNPRIQGTNVDMGAYEWGLSGYLRVTISPQGAIDAGAKWRRVGASAWRDSGSTETGVLVGSHTVEFSDVEGWTNPGSQTVTINNGETTTISRTYNTAQTGSLQVTISPQAAINAGAQWRVDGGAWQVSGYTQTIEVGQYTVEFNDLSGWKKPANQTVTITNDQMALTKGTYVWQRRSGSGVMGVVPQGSVDAGAKLGIDEGSPYDRGYTQTGLSLGQHPVEFNNTAEVKPRNPTATESTAQPANTNNTSMPKMGPTMGAVTPQGGSSATIQWRVDGGAWQTSEYTQTGLSVSEHTVEFTNIAVLIQRENSTGMSSNPQTTNTTATSVQQTGSLTVTVTPQPAIDAGARWRVDGGAWQTSGYTKTGLSADRHTIEFSDVAEWKKPVNQTVRINSGQTTISVGSFLKTYTISASVKGEHGSVKATYQTVTHAGNASILISPDAGFHITSITDNGLPQPIVNPYLILNVTGTHAVVVTFGEILSSSSLDDSSTHKGWSGYEVQGSEQLAHGGNPEPASPNSKTDRTSKGGNYMVEEAEGDK